MMKNKNKAVKILLGIVATVALSLMMLVGCGFLTFEYVNEDKQTANLSETPTSQTSNKSNMNDFNAETLNGENFTSEDLKKYDLTMVNLWFTGCKPCVDKMPDTQELYSKLPENVNMVSICADGNGNKELASKIVSESNVKYPALIPDDKLNESILKNVSVFPTTIFVDKDGNIVGDPMEGSPASNYVDMYLEEVNKRLELVKK